MELVLVAGKEQIQELDIDSVAELLWRDHNHFMLATCDVKRLDDVLKDGVYAGDVHAEFVDGFFVLEWEHEIAAGARAERGC